MNVHPPKFLLTQKFAGWLARDPELLRKVGHKMLQQPTVEAKLPKRVVIAEDCFNLLNASQNRDLWITLSATEKAFGSEFHNVREHSFFFFFQIISNQD